MSSDADEWRARYLSCSEKIWTGTCPPSVGWPTLEAPGLLFEHYYASLRLAAAAGPAAASSFAVMPPSAGMALAKVPLQNPSPRQSIFVAHDSTAVASKLPAASPSMASSPRVPSPSLPSPSPLVSAAPTLPAPSPAYAVAASSSSSSSSSASAASLPLPSPPSASAVSTSVAASAAALSSATAAASSAAILDASAGQVASFFGLHFDPSSPSRHFDDDDDLQAFDNYSASPVSFDEALGPGEDLSILGSFSPPTDVSDDPRDLQSDHIPAATAAATAAAVLPAAAGNANPLPAPAPVPAPPTATPMSMPPPALPPATMATAAPTIGPDSGSDSATVTSVRSSGTAALPAGLKTSVSTASPTASSPSLQHQHELALPAQPECEFFLPGALLSLPSSVDAAASQAKVQSPSQLHHDASDSSTPTTSSPRFPSASIQLNSSATASPTSSSSSLSTAPTPTSYPSPTFGDVEVKSEAFSSLSSRPQKMPRLASVRRPDVFSTAPLLSQLKMECPPVINPVRDDAITVESLGLHSSAPRKRGRPRKTNPPTSPTGSVPPTTRRLADDESHAMTVAASRYKQDTGKLPEQWCINYLLQRHAQLTRPFAERDAIIRTPRLPTVDERDAPPEYIFSTGRLLPELPQVAENAKSHLSPAVDTHSLLYKTGRLRRHIVHMQEKSTVPPPSPPPLHDDVITTSAVVTSAPPAVEGQHITDRLSPPCAVSMLRRLLATLLEATGFQGVSANGFDVLSEVVQAVVAKIGKGARIRLENPDNTMQEFQVLLAALLDMDIHVTFDSLREHIEVEKRNHQAVLELYTSVRSHIETPSALDD